MGWNTPEYPIQHHFGLLPAFLPSLARCRACCSSTVPSSVTAHGWNGPQRALTLCLLSVKDLPWADALRSKICTARGAWGALVYACCAHSCKTHQQGSVYGLESVSSLCRGGDRNPWTPNHGSQPHHLPELLQCCGCTLGISGGHWRQGGMRASKQVLVWVVSRTKPTGYRYLETSTLRSK